MSIEKKVSQSEFWGLRFSKEEDTRTEQNLLSLSSLNRRQVSLKTNRTRQASE